MNESREQLASNFLAVADSLADGKDTNIVFPLSTLRSATMTTNEAAVAAAHYLVDRGYAYYGKHEGELGLSFTRLGFAHIRRQMSEDPPSIPAPTNITNIRDSTVGAVQQGTTGSSQSVEQVNVLTQTEVLAIRGFLTAAREELSTLGLDYDDLVTAEQRLKELDDEVNRQQPDRARVKRALDSLKRIAVGAAGSATWSGLQAVMDMLG